MSVTLLLADDSATIQRVIEMTFADEDVRVVTVGDGREAIERIAADPPDIVLADTNMPETDGYDVSAFVKADGALSHIPVVLLTGAFDPVDDARAREAGCDAVLVKPFEPTAVVGRVRELLGAPAHVGAGPPDGAAAAPEAAVGDGAPTAVEAAGPSESTVPEATAGAVESAAPEVAPGAVESAAPEVAPGAVEPEAPEASPNASEAAESPAPPAGAGASPAAPPPAVPAVEGPAPPTLADAFAALLAAEQGDVARARAAYPWPRQAADDEELVERVAQRVVERLSEEVTGELVSEVVARVAERLVRDQIGRIEPV